MRASSSRSLGNMQQPGKCALNSSRATSDGNTVERQGVARFTRSSEVNRELVPFSVRGLADKALHDNCSLESRLIGS